MLDNKNSNIKYRYVNNNFASKLDLESFQTLEAKCQLQQNISLVYSREER